MLGVRDPAAPLPTCGAEAAAVLKGAASPAHLAMGEKQQTQTKTTRPPGYRAIGARK